MRHPFAILAYVSIPDRDNQGTRIIGARINDSGPLYRGVDYARTVFEHYAKRSKTFGCALAMQVLQSDLYHQLDDTARAECDELINVWCNHLKRDK